MAPIRELARATDPQWAGRLLPHLDELLLEQAHLEKKAAAAAMAFLFRYPDRPALQRPLSRLAREELRHFERVIQLLEQRGQEFGPQHPGPYAERLKRVVRQGEPDRLLDELLVCGVIEARSCERMGLLAEAAAERNPELSGLYRELVTAEVRHRELYVELAVELFGEAEVAKRWTVITRHEAEVLGEIPRAPRLHSA
jgi:tRNA-(ms[2]io[6]A)-hydroxylase